MKSSAPFYISDDDEVFGMFPGNQAIWTPPTKYPVVDNTNQSKEYKSETISTYENIQVCSDTWVEQVNQAALRSAQKGQGPFAAIILQLDNSTDTIIRYWVIHNQVLQHKDPTAHAELLAIRQICYDLGAYDLGSIQQQDATLAQPNELSRCILYASTEPCPMCLSAIYWAGIKTLYFSATRFEASSSGVNFADTTIYNELTHPYVNRRHMRAHHAPDKNSNKAFEYWQQHNSTTYGQTPSDDSCIS